MAVRKRFSPEFVNRIDCMITYQPLTPESLSAILDQQIADLQNHVNTRLGNRCFSSKCRSKSRQFLLKKGTSAEYGARELNRTIHRYLTQPLATLVATNQVNPGARVRVEVDADDEKLHIRCAGCASEAELPAQSDGAAGGRQPRSAALPGTADGQCRLEAAHGGIGHRRPSGWWQTHKPNAALLDYMLPDGNGVELGVEFLQTVPQMLVIVMTGTDAAAGRRSALRGAQLPGLAEAFPGVRRDEPDPQPAAGDRREPRSLSSRIFRTASFAGRDQVR